MFWIGFGAGVLFTILIMTFTLALCLVAGESDDDMNEFDNSINRGDNDGNN